MCWIYDTGEQPIQVPTDKATILDSFVDPLKAIRSLGGNGKICQEVNNNSVASTEMTIKRSRKKTVQAA